MWTLPPSRPWRPERRDRCRPAPGAKGHDEMRVDYAIRRDYMVCGTLKAVDRWISSLGGGHGTGSRHQEMFIPGEKNSVGTKFTEADH